MIPSPMTITMKTIYPTLSAGNAIFSDLQSFEVPWRDANISSTLDYYYLSVSGEMHPAPLLADMSYNSTLRTYEPLTTEQRTVIAGIIFNIYDAKWVRLWNAYNAEYNPISNYDMVESETINKDVATTNSDSGTITHTGTDTVTNTGTIGTTSQGTNDRGVYGFNSATASADSETSASASSTQTNNTTETDTQNLTETHNLLNGGTSDEDITRSLERSGNIGVTTTQQMLTSEIELWQWNYYKSVVDDINSIACMCIY